MTQENVPPRWLEQPDELPAHLSRALAAYEDRAPTAAERAALFAALEVQLASAGVPAVPKSRWLRRLWIPGALGVIAAVLVVLMRTPAPQPAAPSAPAVPAASVLSPTSSAASAAPTEVHTSPDAFPTPDPVNEPTASGALSAAPSARASGARTRPASDPGAELALLTPARRVLASAPARSLELVAEHARRFPRGAFAEERDLLRIEALLHSGQRTAAARYARRFRLSYPHSAHLEHLVTEPLTP